MKLFFILTLCLPLYGAAQGSKKPDPQAAIYIHKRDSCEMQYHKLDSFLRTLRNTFISQHAIKYTIDNMNNFNSCVIRYNDSLRIFCTQKSRD